MSRSPVQRRSPRVRALGLGPTLIAPTGQFRTQRFDFFARIYTKAQVIPWRNKLPSSGLKNFLRTDCDASKAIVACVGNHDAVRSDAMIEPRRRVHHLSRRNLTPNISIVHRGPTLGYEFPCEKSLANVSRSRSSINNTRPCSPLNRLASRIPIAPIISSNWLCHAAIRFTMRCEAHEAST